MPRYFFTVDAVGLSGDDEEGTELDGPEHARLELSTFAGELLKDADGRFWGAPRWRFRVTDEGGATLCELTITGSGG